MVTKQYGECCHRVGFLDRSAKACPECGTPLLRCRGYDECRMLLYRGDHCPGHVAPAVYLDTAAPAPARVGGRVVLPVRIANASNCGSGLRVEKLLTRAPGGEETELPLDWSRLRAGEEKRLFVDSGVLEFAGRVGVDLFLVVSSRIGAYRETYAFTAHLPIEVEADPGAIHVGQAGGDVIVMGRGRPERWSVGDREKSTRLDTVRAEQFEVRQGLRGYPNASRIPRTVVLESVGFPEADGMPRCAPFLTKERLLLGRNSRAYDPPNDLTLRAYLRNGQLNRDLSGAVSGVHFDLHLRDDRLWLNPLGRNGTVVNGEPAKDAGVVRDGDRIRVPANETSGPEFQVRFVVRDGVVETLRLTRTDLAPA